MLVKVSMVVKFIVLIDLIIEFIMYLVEIYQLNQLSQSSVDVVVRFSERRRRKVFAKRQFIRTALWMFIIALGLVICYFAVDE